jgi:hypothetical protein
VIGVEIQWMMQVMLTSHPRWARIADKLGNCPKSSISEAFGAECVCAMKPDV